MDNRKKRDRGNKAGDPEIIPIEGERREEEAGKASEIISQKPGREPAEKTGQPREGKAERENPGENPEDIGEKAPGDLNGEKKTREDAKEKPEDDGGKPPDDEVVTLDLSRMIEALENKLTENESKLREAEKTARETKEAHIRTLAEYDNFRKRARKEKADSFQSGLISAVTRILPIVDTLERALEAPCSDENFKKGIEMTLTSARDALAKLGVEEIDALDKPFDPNLHSAVMQEQVEGKEAGIVTKQFQKGYKIGDKVIRHTVVAVSC